MIEMPIYRPVPLPIEMGEKLTFWQRIKAWRGTTRKYEIMEDWHYNGFDLIPKGFIFDGASIPRCLWWFLSPTGLLLIPGLVHDFDYRYGKDSFDRRLADKTFRLVIKMVTDMKIIPWIAWAAVRLGGWKAWKEHRKND